MKCSWKPIVEAYFKAGMVHAGLIRNRIRVEYAAPHPGLEYVQQLLYEARRASGEKKKCIDKTDQQEV
jgi:predicted transcriptional regulator